MFQTATEREVGSAVAEIFESSRDTVEARLAGFPRYVRRAHLTRFIALYELFKRVLPVKGSIIDCGVYNGFSLMTWAKLSAILEPNNLTRRVYGFDSFEGFPSVSDLDTPVGEHEVRAGDLASSAEAELRRLIELADKDRFLGHIAKTHLVVGDMVETIPRFVEANPHVVVSLLYLDADLYEPTRVALERLLPRMPKGAILAFDELDNPLWPGETLAVLDLLGISELRIERLEFDPYIGFVTL